LTGKQKTLGWRDQFEEATPIEPEVQGKLRYKRKTYLMTDELIRRIETQAEHAGVGVNEMHRYLLTIALTQIESGKYEIEVQTIAKRTLGV